MKAKILLNKYFRIGKVDPRLYGSFVEHMGRGIYGGVYEPGHKSAGRDGFRDDVRDLVRELSVPLLRYPGGNFVSGYHWEDGVGDPAKRPRRMELAWQSVETNEVGLHEIYRWAKTVGAKLMMTVNLGTRGAEEARDLVEYCNGTTDTYYANLRRQNGAPEPFGIRNWCLGNEPDGAWQIGAKTAEEYGRLAAETAKMMKWTDPSIELSVCGSSGDKRPGFGRWDLTVLEQCYDYIDYISIHQFIGNKSGNSALFLGKSVLTDRYIRSVAAFCDAVKAIRRSDKTVFISFDEWNVWYHSLNETQKPWHTAPPLLEDVYNFEDALAVGCMLSVFLNNCDRVKIACLAQLVNVLAPIMTETGGASWRQTTFYPFAYAARYGRGEVLRAVIDCPDYEAVDDRKSAERFRVPYLESAAVLDEKKREIAVFAVARSLDEDTEVTLNLEDFGPVSVLEHIELYAEDLLAVNTKDDSPVSPRKRRAPAGGSKQVKLRLKKHSWNMIRLSYSPEKNV